MLAPLRVQHAAIGQASGEDVREGGSLDPACEAQLLGSSPKPLTAVSEV